MSKKQIGIIGATGYTGSELVRLLVNHPEVEIAVITSEGRAGERFSDVHPFFTGIVDQPLVSSKEIDNYALDLVFLALPHGISMEFVKRFRDKPFKVVDLSGDFRLNSQAVYEEWYKTKHTYPEAIEKAVYGLPELYSDTIANAHLVANPGCFPTCSILAVAPLLKSNHITADTPIIIDAKTGVTGAGIKASAVNQFSNVNDNFKAYGLKTHRHAIEIEHVLNGLSDHNTTIQFTPHLLPVDRGILATTYIRMEGDHSEEELTRIYSDFYRDKPFVRVRNAAPTIKDVRGTNYCDIYVTYDTRTKNLIVISVIDNLVKGAAGQAVQNMNLLFGIDETTGLHQIPLNP